MTVMYVCMINEINSKWHIFCCSNSERFMLKLTYKCIVERKECRFSHKGNKSEGT